MLASFWVVKLDGMPYSSDSVVALFDKEEQAVDFIEGDSRELTYAMEDILLQN